MGASAAANVLCAVMSIRLWLESRRLSVSTTTGLIGMCESIIFAICTCRFLFFKMQWNDVDLVAVFVETGKLNLSVWIMYFLALRLFFPRHNDDVVLRRGKLEHSRNLLRYSPNTCMCCHVPRYSTLEVYSGVDSGCAGK